MTKYLFKRILHGLVSIVIVVALVMIMIYTMLDRNLVFAGDTKYSHTSNNARVAYNTLNGKIMVIWIMSPTLTG